MMAVEYKITEVNGNLIDVVFPDGSWARVRVSEDMTQEQVDDLVYQYAPKPLGNGPAFLAEGAVRQAAPIPEPEPEPQPELTPEQVLALQHRQIVVERDRRIEALGAGYTPTERETWPVQIAEAQALLADPETPAPMLRPIATSRGITPVQMAERVMQLASAKAAASGAILAAARRLADAANAGNLPEDWKNDRHWL